MLSAFISSLSGIRSGLKALDKSAENTAKISVKRLNDYPKRPSEGGDSGVVVDLSGAHRLPSKTDALNPEGDYAKEAVNQMIAKRVVEANIAVLRTADEMERKTIDIFA